jgi:putative membrane protein
VMSTKSHTGILFFVSLRERRAVVLVDETIAKKLPANVWSEVCNLLVSGIRDHSLKEGYLRALKKCEEILKPHFSSTAAHKVEISNELVIK